MPDDSMLPSMLPGAILAIDTSHDDIETCDGAAICVRNGDDYLIRRVQLAELARGRVAAVRPDNRGAGGDILLATSEARAALVGVVVWVCFEPKPWEWRLP